MQQVIDVGVSDGQAALANPTSLKDIMFYYSMKKSGDERLLPLTYG